MRWFALSMALLMLAGCARVSVTTKVSPDGSFTRKIRYALRKAADGGLQSGPQSVQDAFKLPAGVTPVTRTEKDESITEVSETISAGAAPLKDLVMLSEKKQSIVESSVSVRKLPNGNLEYVEHLHWTGDPAAMDEMKVPAEARAMVKKSLPARWQKTEVIDGSVHDLLVTMVHAFFGPSQPIFFELLTNTDAAERRMIGQIVPPFVESLKKRMPDLTDEEAMAMARSVVTDLKMSDFAKEKANAAQPSADPNAKKSDANEMTPMMFVVGFPGKIVESNGITDPLTGEVYWSLYPPSVQIGDVDLKVVATP